MSRFARIGVIVQVNLLHFDAAPESLDAHVVQCTAFAVVAQTAFVSEPGAGFHQ
ncbi:hypothetical protein BH20VER1_BH20VER1_04340 [soil metagenome]